MKFASMVCSHDEGKLSTRTKLFHALSQIDRVDSGGAYLNNTAALNQRWVVLFTGKRSNARQYFAANQYETNIESVEKIIDTCP